MIQHLQFWISLLWKAEEDSASWSNWILVILNDPFPLLNYLLPYPFIVLWILKTAWEARGTKPYLTTELNPYNIFSCFSLVCNNKYMRITFCYPHMQYRSHKSEGNKLIWTERLSPSYAIHIPPGCYRTSCNIKMKMRFCQFRSSRNLKEHKRKYFRTFHPTALSGSIILIVPIRELREKVITKIKTQTYSASSPTPLHIQSNMKHG